MMSYFVREYDPATDAETVSRWWEKRHGQPMALAVLPPVGVVVCDDGGPLCALWLYMSAGIGVAFLENPVSAPGMGLKQAGDVFQLALEAIEAIALTHDYGVLVCHTPPGIARVLRQSGFAFSSKPVLTGEKLIRKPKEESL